MVEREKNNGIKWKATKDGEKEKCSKRKVFFLYKQLSYFSTAEKITSVGIEWVRKSWNFSTSMHTNDIKGAKHFKKDV